MLFDELHGMLLDSPISNRAMNCLFPAMIQENRYAAVLSGRNYTNCGDKIMRGGR